MKTYSIAILSSRDKSRPPFWVTNWGQFAELDEIDWHEVNDFVANADHRLGYGYYYGHNSRDLTSPRCRTELYIKPA